MGELLRRRAAMAENGALLPEWDYEWDYTMGKLEEQTGWYVTKSGTTLSEMTEDGQKLAAGNSAQIFIRPSDDEIRYTKNGIGVIEAVCVLNLRNTSTTTGFRFGLGPGSSGANSGLHVATPNRVLKYNSSSSTTDVTVMSLSNNVEYTIRLELDGDTGRIYVNGELKKTMQGRNSTTSPGQFFVVQANASSTSYYTILKSVKIKTGRL